MKKLVAADIEKRPGDLLQINGILGIGRFVPHLPAPIEWPMFDVIEQVGGRFRIRRNGQEALVLGCLVELRQPGDRSIWRFSFTGKEDTFRLFMYRDRFSS